VGTGSGNTPSGGPPLLLFHNFYSGGYFQDDWKVTRKLTLNLGLRYDYNAPSFKTLSEWQTGTTLHPLQFRCGLESRWRSPVPGQDQPMGL